MKVSTKKGPLGVCYFGTYSMEEGYPRNRVIIEGLRKNGVEVIECHVDFWKDTAEKLEGVKASHGMLKTIFKLITAYGRLIKKFMKLGPYDALIVGYAGHIDIFLAKFLNLFRRRPIIFDAFLSLYDTAVVDRKIVPPGSLKAVLLRLIDTWACRLADAVLLDTQAHVDYFVQEFRLPAEKFFVVPVGSSIKADENSPIPQTLLDPPLLKGEIGGFEHKFEVLYFGSYIPLHGVDVILKAARTLQEKEKDVVFTLIGKGQLLPEMKQLASDLGLKNINFIDRFVEEGELSKYIQQADSCLGIFGKTEKALRVIPCKIYNCLAMGKPLITAQTPAIEEVLTHEENACLCRPDDPDELAMAVLRLKIDTLLRERIARHGQECFEKHFSVEVIGVRVLEILQGVT